MQANSKNLWSIGKLGAQLRAGDITCADLAQLYITCIEDLDQSLQAWVLVDAESAVRQAQALDEKLQNGHDLGPWRS